MSVGPTVPRVVVRTAATCVAHEAETPKPVDGAHVGAAAPVGWEGGGRGSGGNDKDAIKACVNEMTAAGWPVQEAFTACGTFSPQRRTCRATRRSCSSQSSMPSPSLRTTRARGCTTRNETHALPLTHESLSCCMGEGCVYESGSASVT